MQKITELTRPPIVGEEYLVPCVMSAAADWCSRTIPVLGDFHSDLEIIGFPEEHIHIDFRFISKREFSELHFGYNPGFNIVVSKKNVILTDGELLTWETRKCRRKMPKFPSQNKQKHTIWMPKLETHYKDARLNCGKCPHRGIDLNLIEGDRYGNKTCPGHGLMWNRGGELLTRTI